MELSDLKGVGPARISRLRAMGISSLRDLLYFFPVRYEDRVHLKTLDDLLREEGMVQGVFGEKPGISYFHGTSRVTAVFRAENSAVSVCWFNAPWMVQQLPIGQPVLIYGRITVKNGRKTLYNPRLVSEKGWIPVYRTVKGIPSRTLQQMIQEALDCSDTVCPETLPPSLLERYHLPDLRTALIQRHFPETPELLRLAKRRLDFETMLIYLAGVALFREDDRPGFAMQIPAGSEADFWRAVPFAPTNAQVRVLHEIARDLQSGRSMSRLVQGDVGCGKTILAFGAVYLSACAGYQSAMMTPTEILARQHYENAVRQLAPLGLKCALLTGSTKAAERKAILRELKEGTCSAVFGTHALISRNVEYARLGLVITDEQHRFGVRQRSHLQEKGMRSGDARAPHVLVMSATPIPRTMALILYGDLSLSIVDELPPGRIPVRTRLVPSQKEEAMYQFLRETVHQGRQAYIVCPLVEDSEALPELRSARSLCRELSEGPLRDVRIGITWGTQKSADKTETLQRFASGELDVLVATTVIEVGVNVPNATVMIIQNAERYGLSTLHQLRGRVGRGTAESWCFLRADSAEKLEILCRTEDGFEIAQKDLEQRGPGDLMGTRQSGEALLQFSGESTARLLDEAQQCVRELWDNPLYAGEKAAVQALAYRTFEEKDFKIALN